LEALHKNSLYFNPKKCHFHLLKLDFLGHHISVQGVEANLSKVSQVLDWLILKNATDIRSFLGLVRYIATYLPKLAGPHKNPDSVDDKRGEEAVPDMDRRASKSF
jgi:hypothetical protein